MDDLLSHKSTHCQYMQLNEDPILRCYCIKRAKADYYCSLHLDRANNGHFHYFDVETDFVDETRVVSGADCVQLQMASNMRTMTV